MKTEPVPDLELIALEEAFADDCKCDSRHQNPENAYCSGAVTYLLTYSCDSEVNRVCDAAGKYAQRCTSARDNVCADCDLPCFECWTIRPI